MRSIREKSDLIERVHKLIQRRGTGTPDELASRLNMSKATVFRLIECMKDLGAPIVYDFLCQTYTYESPVEFFFGFSYPNELREINGRDINGGFARMGMLSFL